jgi:hypothetical protein
VKGADGKLDLSKNAKAFHPGKGAYRSSYKNAMRLTRTETNASYRLADQDQWQRMDFVVSMRVHKSNNHPTEVFAMCWLATIPSHSSSQHGIRSTVVMSPLYSIQKKR